MSANKNKRKFSTEGLMLLPTKGHRFYTLNKATGETKLCAKDIGGPSPTCGEASTEQTDKRDSPPRIQEFRTPAQDRLKRLQHNLQQEKKKTSQNWRANENLSNNKTDLECKKIMEKYFEKIENQITSTQPTKDSNRNSSVEINQVAERRIIPTSAKAVNKDMHIKQVELKEKISTSGMAVNKDMQVKAVSLKRTISTSDILAHDDTQVKEKVRKQDDNVKLLIATKSPKKDNTSTSSALHNRPTFLSRKARRKQLSAQHKNLVASQVKTTESLKDNSKESSVSKSGNITNEQPVMSKNRGLGGSIIDKFKTICKSTFKSSSKKPPDSLKSITKPVVKAVKNCSLMKFCKSDDSPSHKMLLSNLMEMTPSPTQKTPIQLVIPSYKPGSANKRLELLRKSIIAQTPARPYLDNTTSTSKCATITSSSNNSVLSKDFEPMDWQPIEGGSEEISLKQSNDETTYKTSETSALVSNKAFDTEDQTVNEYYDAVNENLLRFSAQKQKNTSQKWLRDRYYFVIDTNVLLNHITFVQDLTEMKLCDTNGSIIFIPYIVLQELDKLKMCYNREGAKTLAVRAIKYLNKKFEERNEHVHAQSARDERQHVIDITSPDDSIINCCLQAKQHVENLLLLTEDINLRNKAMCNNILASTKSDLISIYGSVTSV